MNRRTVPFTKLSHYTNSGWMVAWIGREDNLLFIDFFANWRLQDGKSFFVQCEYPEDRRQLENWLASVQKQWNREIAEWQELAT